MAASSLRHQNYWPKDIKCLYIHSNFGNNSENICCPPVV